MWAPLLGHKVSPTLPFLSRAKALSTYVRFSRLRFIAEKVCFRTYESALSKLESTHPKLRISPRRIESVGHGGDPLLEGAGSKRSFVRDHMWK